MRRNMHIGLNEVNHYTIMVDMLFSSGLVFRKNGLTKQQLAFRKDPAAQKAELRSLSLESHRSCCSSFGAHFGY